MTTALKIVGVVVIALVVFVIGFTTYSCLIAGPHLTARPTGDGIRVEGRFLGEYSLGFNRVQIRDIGSDTLVCDVVGSWSADLDLRPGVNTPETMFGPSSGSSSTKPTAQCQLVRSKRFRATLWGNNGWGRARPSSIQIGF